MSHAVKMEVDFKQSQEHALVCALEVLVGEGNVEVHETPVNLKTYSGTVAEDLPKCHIVIRKKHLGRYVADAGYVRDSKGGYEAYLDKDYYFKAPKMDKISQEYAANVTTKNLKAQGYLIKRTETNGKIRILASKYS